MTDRGKEGEGSADGDIKGGKSEDGVTKLPISGSGGSIDYGRGEGGPADEDIISIEGAASSGATGGGGGGELGRGDNLPASSAPVRAADPVPGEADIGGWGVCGGGGGGYSSAWSGPGRGGTGYGIDVGSGNWAAGGNDIRIRNVLGQLSEGTQVGSHNVSGVDNVMRLDLSANPSPQTAYRDVAGDGDGAGAGAAGGGGGG